MKAEDIQREDVVREALEWIGTPFHHRARLKHIGVDCGQFPLAVFETCGLIPHYDPGMYAQDFHLHNEKELYLEHLERFTAKVEEPQPGDIAMFRFGRVLSHGSIVVKWPMVVHAFVESRAVILDDAVNNMILAPRYVGAWSYWAKNQVGRA